MIGEVSWEPKEDERGPLSLFFHYGEKDLWRLGGVTNCSPLSTTEWRPSWIRECFGRLTFVIYCWPQRPQAVQVEVAKEAAFFSGVWRTPCRGGYFNKLLHKKLRFTWGWAEVLSMAHIIQILDKLKWPDLFSLSLLFVSLVLANEWEGTFFWPIVFSGLCCDTQTRMRLHTA